MALGNYLGALSQGTDATTTGNVYGQFIQQQQMAGGYYSQHTVMNQLQNAYAYGQAITAITPEKIFKTAKGLLAELREEIDTWHGNILRV